MSPIAPYGSWRSPITGSFVARGTLRFREMAWDGDVLYWIEMRPDEGGRCAIVRQVDGAPPADVLGVPWNARSRVHEYGGGSFTAHSGEIFFTHFPDQRIYRFRDGRTPRPLTGEDSGRHADLRIDGPRRRLLAVRESHSPSRHWPENSLVSLSLEERSHWTLHEGRDFYAAPRLSPDGKSLAFLAWDLPNMPWDGCELWLADLDDAGRARGSRCIAGGKAEALFQPAWSPAGELHFVSDRTGWWNLYRWRSERAEPLCPMEAELGLPQWVFGMSTYAFLPDGRILCAFIERGIGKLALWEGQVILSKLRRIETPYTDFQFLRSGAREVAFLAGSPTEPPQVARLHPGDLSIQVVRKALAEPLEPNLISSPESLEFPTTHAEVAHAFFYPPRNDGMTAPVAERPPLVVISHGGPTGSASPTLDLGIQFWTSRGFAVLDVNYRGSTGYGRAYRNRLRGGWGVLDVEDCIAGAKAVVAMGRADGERLIIRGGSAGGYTTLCALTFHRIFKAGASYYGVSDIEALLRDTHKFEGKYDHFLIGPYETARALYRERSPIHSTDRLNCPLILFQGMEDRVVPPNQSERIFEAVKKKGLPVAYLAFEGEQHGFRKAENIQRALEAELFFYSRVFGFPLADPVEPVVIENI